MAVLKANNAQRDFTGGEADSWIKRADDLPQHKSVARQMSNWRTLTSRALANRPGRRLIGGEQSRVDEVIMSPGNSFYLAFGTPGGFGYLRVYNAAFTKVFDSGNIMPWQTAATAATIVWDSYKLSIYICFDGMRPQVLSWDGASQTSTWTLVPYQEQVTVGGQKRTVFYRLTPHSTLITTTALVGQVGVGFSDGFVQNAGLINTRIRVVNRQIVITALYGSTNTPGVPPLPAQFAPLTNYALANVIEQLYIPQSLTNAIDNSQFFDVGQEIIGQTSGAKGIIFQFFGGGQGISVSMLNSTPFVAGETIVGPNGSIKITSAGLAGPGPGPQITWDEEVMNTFRGFPRSCFVDQSRLGFCDFPALPGLIVWSAVGAFDDLYTDDGNVGPTNAIQELVPGKSRVLHVVPGSDGSEFVFCDNAVYYIPINQNTPLKPGSVSFNTLSSEGIAPQVKPRPVGQSIVYVSAGNTQLKAVQSLGAFNKPYIVDDISDMHFHLLNAPVAIAAPGGSDQFEESYFYILNVDSSIILCRFETQDGMLNTKTMGYLPWTNSGSVTWISALKGHSDVLISAIYGATALIEQVDAAQYLDAAVLYNNIPASIKINGKGVYWFGNSTVDVMDGLRMMGTYQVDVNGFLIPQNNAGEDFTSPTLTVGKAWTAILEPFIPAVQPGQDVQQRLRKRRVARFEVYVQNSTGFTMCRIAGAPKKRLDPPAGTVMQRRRFDAWNQDDDPTLPPPLREQAYSERPIGRFHDPRVAIIKDTPGPLTILELGLEVTV